MSLKIHPALATIIIAGLIILLFMLVRGCNNSQQAVALNTKLKIANDSLAAEVVRNKTEIIKNQKEHDTQLEVANGQVELKENQLAKTEDELGAANKRINILIAKHKDITPNPDTSVTIVSNDFITDCNGCFTELANGQRIVQKYKTDIDQLNFEWHKKSIIQTNRINQQEQEKSNLTKTLHDCMEISKAAQKAGTPKGQLYFSWNVIWSPFPNAAAVGLLYQNKRKLQYGLRWGYGTFGQFVETEMNLPLSLNRKNK